MVVLKAKAYAKINLFLDITGLRHDGYHELDTVMQSVSLFDEVSVTLGKGTDILVTYSDGFSSENDLVTSVCKAFCELADFKCGLSIHIEKNIPASAGMAGVSADAAAALTLLNKLSNRNYPTSVLIEFAAKFGADIPFCLIGGTCHAKGIGELLTQVNSPVLHYVLLKKGEKESTGKMFSRLDNENYISRGCSKELLCGLKNADTEKICDNLFNAFEVCWDMGAVSKHFKPFKPLKVFLSGSGPTVVALFEDKHSAMSCAQQLKVNGLTAFYAHTVKSGVEIV